MAHGTSLLATYTWSHALDDAPTPLGTTGDAGYRQNLLVPIKLDYSNTGFDTRHRFTMNAFYELPFGRGRKWVNDNTLLDYVVGGWSANATFVAQSGNPFTVYPSGITSPGGGSTRAIKSGDPFATGGSSPVADCATKTRNRDHWFNPCSFTNPWNANDPTGDLAHYIPKDATDKANTGAPMPVYVSDLPSVLGYLGGKRDEVVGPGYERVNMSVFKSFKTYREQSLEFRTDAFNVFNTPSLADPSSTNINTQGGAINSPKSLQHLAPDSRFFQLSLRYQF